MATTLDPANMNSGGTLSNGNLTFTTASGSAINVISTASKSSGKWYFEVTINAQGSTTSSGRGALGVSVANSLRSSGSLPGNGTVGVTWWNYDTNIYYNGSGTSAGGSGTNGITVGVAIDIGNKNAWIYLPGSGNWDGQGGDNPATNTGGMNGSHFNNGALNTMFASPIFAELTVENGSEMTINFGASLFAHTIPSGFLAWDPNELGNMFFCGR